MTGYLMEPTTMRRLRLAHGEIMPCIAIHFRKRMQVLVLLCYKLDTSW
jgi:hypothetical protein